MVRLMLGLISAVYLLLADMSVREHNLPRSIIPTVVAVSAVVGVWVFAPGFLTVGSLTAPLAVRQAGLAVGGLAIIARYAAIRQPAREKSAAIPGMLSTPLLGVCLAVTSANWLVAVAAAVLVGTDLVRRAATSAGEESTTPPLPPGTE